ncbi:class II D-tagatose-bisphosphate aldolase non-catalytic subunit, partial [Rhizobium ruizarguesonis]
VGPVLTFALREALYGLDAISDVLAGRTPRTGLVTTMEKIMVEQPTSWSSHYGGIPDEERLQRHFSYSDRIRHTY